ncbi:hypothetical protein GLV98_12285 [Halobacillus litoralis]|uniref:PIN domain-containing protein n=1 Tax=Halobacillus litoralis TaxID=45668 RepID=A0A845E3B8_9BACI|nr:type II toxin-antitoxin system VapC family toxin [Halobacillus litoralis]MYL50267.1 hypothetical protein [Halobacillus litoralis]
MSIEYFFFDSSAIAKLYVTEVASHVVDDIYSNENNIILLSELAYTETVCATLKMKNTGKITAEDYQSAIDTFNNDFLTTEEDRIMPIAISDIISNTQDVMLRAHNLKDKGHPQLQYLKSLDSIQLTSWLEYAAIKPTFVTGDRKLALIAEAYSNFYNLEMNVIDVSSCDCAECRQIYSNENAV